MDFQAFLCALPLAKGFGLQRAAPRIANFRNPLSHASHASHTSHLQSASREAPRLAKHFTLHISKREVLGRTQECARTEQARRQFAARPKMGLCASCREAPAVVQRFGCQRSSEAARRLGADSRSRSNFTARGNHMPPHLSSEGFEGGGQQLKKKSSSFFNRQLNVRLGIPKSSHDLPLRTSSAKARCSGVRRLSA